MQILKNFKKLKILDAILKYAKNRKNIINVKNVTC